MRRILIFVYVPLAVIYIVMSWIYPTDPATIAVRHLSKVEARGMALTLAISLIIVWLFAFYGAWRLREYSSSIKQYPDGKGFMSMSTGILLIALYLPIRSVAKIILNYSAFRYPSLTQSTNLVVTYLCIIIPLIAYLFISRAAQGLVAMTKAKISLRMMYLLALAFCLLAVTYCYATFTNANKLTPSDWLITTDYEISEPIRMLTILVPYLFMWSIGLIAVYEIYIYQKVVKGIVYRQCLRLLCIGLAIEILASICMQYVTAIAASITKIPTPIMLVILYSVLILIAVAFCIIAKGVSRLRRLETT